MEGPLGLTCAARLALPPQVCFVSKTQSCPTAVVLQIVLAKETQPHAEYHRHCHRTLVIRVAFLWSSSDVLPLLSLPNALLCEFMGTCACTHTHTCVLTDNPPPIHQV